MIQVEWANQLKFYLEELKNIMGIIQFHFAHFLKCCISIWLCHFEIIS